MDGECAPGGGEHGVWSLKMIEWENRGGRGRESASTPLGKSGESLEMKLRGRQTFSTNFETFHQNLNCLSQHVIKAKKKKHMEGKSYTKFLCFKFGRQN